MLKISECYWGPSVPTSLEEDMEVVGQAHNGEEAIELVEKHQPDICIMDIEMPGKTGLEAAEELKKYDCKVIILTTLSLWLFSTRGESRGKGLPPKG